MTRSLAASLTDKALQHHKRAKPRPWPQKFQMSLWNRKWLLFLLFHLHLASWILSKRPWNELRWIFHQRMLPHCLLLLPHFPLAKKLPLPLLFVTPQTITLFLPKSDLLPLANDRDPICTPQTNFMLLTHVSSFVCFVTNSKLPTKIWRLPIIQFVNMTNRLIKPWNITMWSWSIWAGNFWIVLSAGILLMSSALIGTCLCIFPSPITDCLFLIAEPDMVCLVLHPFLIPCLLPFLCHFLVFLARPCSLLVFGGCPYIVFLFLFFVLFCVYLLSCNKIFVL